MHVIAATYHKTLFMGKSITNQTCLQHNIDALWCTVCCWSWETLRGPSFECKPLAGTCHVAGVTSEPSMTKPWTLWHNCKGGAQYVTKAWWSQTKFCTNSLSASVYCSQLVFRISWKCSQLSGSESQPLAITKHMHQYKCMSLFILSCIPLHQQ